MALRGMLNLIFTFFVVIRLVFGAGFECFDCKKVSDPDSCKVFSLCNNGERCFKEVVETEDGAAEYNWGCASAQLCTLEGNLSNRRKRLGIEKCFECCDGNFCNFGACVKDFCAYVTCANSATCRNTAVGAVCDCPAGYTGDLCQTEINECSSMPCQNNGRCTDLIARYQCTCQVGFTGTNCETNINDCQTSPCKNGATCVDGINSYSCLCSPGYTGNQCEVDIDECSSSPCQYNSTCVDKVNEYQCRCPGGITGVNCEINIDECQNVTCTNGGTCVDYINAFVCTCPLGFTGTFCEISLGRVCYICEGMSQVENCLNETICAANEECYMEHELVSPGVFNFNLGCVPTQMCAFLQSGPQPQRRNSRPIQLCYDCCDMNGCNHHACAETRFQGSLVG